MGDQFSTLLKGKEKLSFSTSCRKGEGKPPGLEKPICLQGAQLGKQENLVVVMVVVVVVVPIAKKRTCSGNPDLARHAGMRANLPILKAPGPQP
jgi:hypothetical protein